MECSGLKARGLLTRYGFRQEGDITQKGCGSFFFFFYSLWRSSPRLVFSLNSSRRYTASFTFVTENNWLTMQLRSLVGTRNGVPSSCHSLGLATSPN